MPERIKPNPKVPQLPLREQGEDESLPANLSGLRDGHEIHRILAGQRLWQEKPERKTKAVLVDERDGVSGIMDPENMRFIEVSKGEQIRTKKRPSAFVFVTESISRDDKEQIAAKLEKSKKQLTTTGVVYVFEEKTEGHNLDLDWRLGVLKEEGFAKSDVKHGLTDRFIVWRGRLKKKAKRSPTNLIESNRVEYYRILWRRMQKMYKKHGYKVINAKDSEILREMESTTFPRQTISSLAIGFGVEVRAERCGCEWQVTMNGTWMNTKECKLGVNICQGSREDIFGEDRD